MRTHLEFTSSDFPAYPGEEQEINPGRFGKRLAEFLAQKLPEHGFSVSSIGSEDWGVMVELENDAFPLWIGCGNYEAFENGFLCFIEPSVPIVRNWFKKIETGSTVEKLATAIDAILIASGKVSSPRWWPENEVKP